jgi:patatin-like phospholipase
MIKDVMVRLDGTAADGPRLAAAQSIAETFDGQIIGLFLNPLPLPVASVDGAGEIQAAELFDLAKELGDTIEANLTTRLAELGSPAELRRFDVLPDEIVDVATREARSADTFVTLRPNGELEESDRFVEVVLFGSGRHLFLVPQKRHAQSPFHHVMVAWNGSRESARALAEAMPYLYRKDAPRCRGFRRVAEEHRRGRRLIVVTTNLDAQRSVVWNLGAIAASARPDRFDICEVLVASASIPGVFSPVLIDVESHGRHFNEMHVDGGVTRNVLVAPDAAIAAGRFLPNGASGRIYVIINNKIAPDFDVVKDRPLPVITRSASTMIKANTNAVLLATAQFARSHGLEFRLAAIDPTYPTSPTNDFSQEYLFQLFQHGVERGRSGNVWQSRNLPGPATANSDLPDPPIFRNGSPTGGCNSLTVSAGSHSRMLCDSAPLAEAGSTALTTSKNVRGFFARLRPDFDGRQGASGLGRSNGAGI